MSVEAKPDNVCKSELGCFVGWMEEGEGFLAYSVNGGSRLLT
jgi:hypothetical protein